MSEIRKCLECAEKGYNVGETTKDICSLCYSKTVRYDDFIAINQRNKIKKNEI